MCVSRLLGIYKYDEQSNGRISCSTSWVAWKFCRTRVILGMLMHMLSVLMALIAIGVFLTLVLQAMEGELNIDQCTNATVRLNEIYRSFGSFIPQTDN